MNSIANSSGMEMKSSILELKKVDNELIGDESDDNFTDDNISVVQGNTQIMTLVGTRSNALATVLSALVDR